MIKLLTFLMILFLCFSCRQATSLEKALQMAGENRKELEKVLKKYEQDELKYKAAVFLIENMIYYQYVEGEWLDTYLSYYEYYGERELSPEEVIKKVEREKGGLTRKDKEYKRDIMEIDSVYLVQNIEWSFKVWKEQPWGKHISFEDFCKWILPYRIQDEKLSWWREDMYLRYNHYLDSIRHLPEAADPLFAARHMLDILSERGTVWTAQFRALGIPCGIDYFPAYSDNNDGHFWNFFTDRDRQFYVADFPDKIIRPAADLNARKSKTYRLQFEFNQKMANRMGKDKSSIPSAFRYPLFEDVTPLYMDSIVYDLSIPLDCLSGKVHKDELVYLCTPAYSNWLAIDWGKVKKGKVCFEKVEGKCVFCVAVWRGGEYQRISDAFYMDEKGEVRFYTYPEEKEEAVLYSKYNIYHELFTRRMMDGVFEGSQHPDFRPADTLYIIRNQPVRLYTTVYPVSDKKYRYVRYYGPEDGFCNVAEIAFYEKSTDISPLQGKITGTPGSFWGDAMWEYTSAFDGNPYTSFDYKESYGGWAGMDLGKPCSINKIVYTPRNRDNFIRAGDRYELFYFRGGEWQTLGQKVASSDSLLFRIPVGSLLLLKNYTRGKTERIFEYMDGRQVYR